MSPTIDTQITAVTVYTDRALVTRQGTISLVGSERELHSKPITAYPRSRISPSQWQRYGCRKIARGDDRSTI